MEENTRLATQHNTCLVDFANTRISLVVHGPNQLVHFWKHFQQVCGYGICIFLWPKLLLSFWRGLKIRVLCVYSP